MRNSFSILIVVVILCNCSTESSDSSKIKLNFSLPASSSDPTISREVAVKPDAVDEIIWINMSALEPELNRKPVTGADQGLELDPDSIYAIGFVNNSLPSAGVARRMRSIAGSIRLIGNLHLVSTGLSSIPVSSNAAPEIDLGVLTYESGLFQSGLNSLQTAAYFGYSEDALSSFGKFDSALYVFLNPDVNENGVYDQDEGYDWKITQLRYFVFDGAAIQDDWSIAEPVDAYIRQHGIYFWLGTAFPQPPKEQVFLRFPENNIYMKDGEQIYGGFASHEWPNQGGYHQYSFNLRPENVTPRPPYNGDYELQVGTESYVFKNMHFPGGDGASYDGILIPALRFTFDESGILVRIHCQWKMVAGQGFIDASPEDVQLRIKAKEDEWQTGAFNLDFDIDGGLNISPEGFGQAYYDNFDIDVSSLDLHQSELQAAYENLVLVANFMDLTGCFYRISYEYDFNVDFGN